MGSELKVVLVGAGNMGTNHARVISSASNAQLTTIVDPREHIGLEIADRFGSTWAPELPDLTGIGAL
jgi:predicted dehydrogenase